MKNFDLIKKISAVFFFFITLASIFVLFFLLIEFKNSPKINKDNLVYSLTSRIYDKNNNLIATIGNERREFVSYDDIPQTIKDAVLSVEDSRFYSHIGLDPKRIIKALLVNVSAGSSLEGGSTITQQVVKTSLLSSKKTYERKIQEALLALELESKYTKEDILEMYLNKIFYSDHRYGIKSAAKYFYNKDLKELSVDQIALLAGIPQQPVTYNPYANKEAAKQRRDTVLYAMYNNGKLSKDEYENSVKIPIEQGLVERTKEERRIQSLNNPKYGAYVDLIIKEVQKNPVFTEEKDPFSLGLHIYTNLNPNIQEYVQNMLDGNLPPMNNHPSQSAITVLDTKTGLVEAVAGGKNYKYGDFNFAIDSKLQPGSSIKPIFDYAPGIEYYGWDSMTTFEDKPYIIAGTNRHIMNWDRRYHGNVTMKKSLAMSYNIPSVKAFESLGFERVKQFANKLDIEIYSQAPTVAIGGNVETVSPLNMAGAFAAFGNKGYYNKPSGIIKILDNQGNEINGIKTPSKKAMNESTAFIITDILKDVLTSNGTSPFAKVEGLDLAAKSGSTTFDDSLAEKLGINVVSATKDSWLVGYSTKYTISVWQGVDSADSAEKALDANQTYITQIMFANIMKKIHENIKPEKFEKPNTVEQLGKLYFAKDRNTETDNLYAGTIRDSVYQSKISEKNREEQKEKLSIKNILKILPKEDEKEDKKNKEKQKNKNNTRR